MSGVLCTGLPGLPLTSNFHRLSFLLNDPEVTTTPASKLAFAPDI
jgi:hypothetical protein